MYPELMNPSNSYKGYIFYYIEGPILYTFETDQDRENWLRNETEQFKATLIPIEFNKGKFRRLCSQNRWNEHKAQNDREHFHYHWVNGVDLRQMKKSFW